MNDYITMGEIIRHYRKEAGMSQESLAMGICDRKYLSQLENNQKIPTLYTVNLLSERLGINLYDTYALMLRHHDIETHKKIEILNQHFTIDKIPLLKTLIDEYENLPEFQSGEPLQYLKSAKAIYIANHLSNQKASITTALEGLSTNKHFSLTTNTQCHFTNIELAV